MIADIEILKLSKFSLQMKQLLPEYSGIYYVLDEDDRVWYIGQAKNIRKRWQGKTHHRINQLEAQKKKQFKIYCEPVSESQLDRVEKHRIESYQPHLNSSSVKTKKVRPVETLLRETIATISDFVFILGVELPRQEIQSQSKIDWLMQKKVLALKVIHVGWDINLLREKFNPSSEEQESLIKTAFISRKAYASKWEKFPRFYPFMYRLCVNGYAIEVNSLNWWSSNTEGQDLREYIETSLAQEPIEALTPDSLAKIQNEADENKQWTLHLKRLVPYNSDLIKVLFNDPIDPQACREKLNKISEDYKTGSRGLGSRSRPIKSRPIHSEFTTIEELLLSRGIDIEKYSGGEVINFDRACTRMGLRIKCFSTDLKMPRQQYISDVESHKHSVWNSAYGIINHKKINTSSCNFDIVYFLAGVDKKGWLLIEEYLQDFASPAFSQLSNGVGYVEKFYVSARKYIVPAKVNIKLETVRYSAWIPFGPSEEYSTFEVATDEIRKRLKNSGLPELKVGFKRETIAK